MMTMRPGVTASLLANGRGCDATAVLTGASALDSGDLHELKRLDVSRAAIDLEGELAGLEVGYWPAALVNDLEIDRNEIRPGAKLRRRRLRLLWGTIRRKSARWRTNQQARRNTEQRQACFHADLMAPSSL